MAQPPLREHYNTDEEYFKELDIYNTQVASDLENITTGTSDVETGEDDEAYPTVGDLRIGYQNRYLHTRYGTSAIGADFTNDYTAISGLTVFQGLRNSSSFTESTNPAEYTWREINVVAGWKPNYRIFGGRLVDWNFNSITPNNFTIDNAAGAIDLDNFASGATGSAGTGFEDVFAVTTAPLSAIPSGQLPLSAWNYNQPQTVGGLTWSVSAPSVTSGTPLLWRSRRVVSGAPAVGDSVATTWETPSLIGRFGSDGASVTGPGGSANRLDIAYFATANGSDPVYPTGTLAGDNYAKAVRGTRNFQGTNIVTWVGGAAEPAVSTTASDYEITQLTGDTGETGTSNQVYFAYANSIDGLVDFSTSYFTDALYVGTDVVSYVSPATPVQSSIAGSYEWARLKGEVGDDAYTIAVANGFEGTRAEWLVSLIGAGATVTAIAGGARITDGAGNSVDVEDGNNGADGNGIEIIYTLGTSLPTTPSPSAGAPSGWTFALPTTAQAGQRLYASIGTRVNNTGNYIWTAAILFNANSITVAQVDNGATITDGTSSVTITNGANGAPPEIMYSNQTSNPGTPATAPAFWQSSSTFVQSTTTVATADVYVLEYDENDVSSLVGGSFNFRSSSTSFIPLDDGWPSTGTAWLRQDFDSSSDETAFENALGINSLTDTLPTNPRITLSDGTNSATYTILSITTSASDSILELDTTSEVIVGAPVQANEYNVSLSYDIQTSDNLAQYVAIRVAGGDWEISDFRGDVGLSSIQANITHSNGSVFSLGTDGVWSPPEVVTIGDDTTAVYERLGPYQLGSPTDLAPSDGRFEIYAEGVEPGSTGTLRPLNAITASDIGTRYQLIIDDEDEFDNNHLAALSALNVGNLIRFQPEDDTVKSDDVFNDFRVESVPSLTSDNLYFMEVTLVGAASSAIDATFEVFLSTDADVSVIRTISTRQDVEFLRAGTGEVLARDARLLTYNTGTEVMTIADATNASGDTNPTRISATSELSANRGEVTYTYSHDNEKVVQSANILIQQRGLQGVAGDAPPATAIVNIYTRSATQPTTLPSLVLNYVVSDATSSFQGDVNVSNGWYTSAANVPAGTGNIWQRSGTVVTTTNNGAIIPSSWAGAVQTGSTGANGQDAPHIQSVAYYQRTNSNTVVPAGPQNVAMFDFSTFTLSPAVNSSWSRALPPSTNGRYLWRTLATASVVGTVDMDIATSEWSTPEVILEDGQSPTVVAIDGGIRVTGADGMSVDVLDGSNGMDGDGIEIIYRVAASKPGTPTASSTVPSGWSTTVPTVPDGQRLYLSVGTRANNSGNYTWTPPVIFSANTVTVTGTGTGATVSDGVNSISITNGMNGAAGTGATVTNIDGGVRVTDGTGASVDVLDGDDGMDGDGLEVIYRNATSAPSTPSPSAGAPSGWSFTLVNPTGENRTYISIGTRTNNAGNYTWSPALPFSGRDGLDSTSVGPAGDSFRTVYLYQNGVTAPTAPSSNVGFNSAGNAVATGSWTTSASVPPAGQTIFVASLLLRRANNVGNWVNSGSWIVNAAGSGGTNGTDAPRFAEIVLYTNPAVSSAPSAPSATITWANGNISSITSGWSVTPPTQVATSNLVVFSSVLVFIDTAPPFTSTTATGSPPVQSTSFSGLVTFTGGDFAVDGSTITSIDGGNITTGTIGADQIAAGSITADELSANFILSRTVRSPNYVAPTVGTNPPNEGYSLEHGQGIGYFEEVRANVTGTLQAPTGTIALGGNINYGPGSVVTKEYLNVTKGDPLTEYPVTFWESGNSFVMRGIISEPIWRLENIVNPRVYTGVSSETSGDSQPGTLNITNFDGSGVELYSQVLDSGTEIRTTRFLPMAIPYSNGVAIPNSLLLSDIGTFASLNNGVGYSRGIDSDDPVDASAVNSLVNILGVRAEVGAVIPDRIDIVLGLFNDTSNSTNTTSNISIRAGINSNSAVTLRIETADGATLNRTLTQL